MKAALFAQRDFSGGQVNAAARRRDDSDAVRTGALTMRNWRIEATGQLVPRPGRRPVFVSDAARCDYLRMGVGYEFMLCFSAGKIVIAPDTYKGQTQAVQTFGLPVGAYTTTKMDDATAYQIVKTFWTQRPEMAKTNPWWGSLSPDQVMALGIKLHPGAVKFYTEQGITIPDAMK